MMSQYAIVRLAGRTSHQTQFAAPTKQHVKKLRDTAPWGLGHKRRHKVHPDRMVSDAPSKFASKRTRVKNLRLESMR